jgi:carboxylate-amine ligase
MTTASNTAPVVPMKREQQTSGWLDWTKSLPSIFRFGKKQDLVRDAEAIRFKPNGFLTLGVEIEINLINPVTCQLQNRGEEVLKAATALKKVKPEFCQDTIEVNTGICQDVHAAETDLKTTFASLKAICGEMGLAMCTTAIHPTADFHESKLYDSPRYKANLERVRWLLRRSIAIGLHVHIGMKSAQDCIRYNNFYLHFLPHFLALSASSPFWRGEDTGLVSSRPSAYEAIPTAGPPYPLQSWGEFEELYWSLKNCGAISSLKDLWWDARPSPGYGTLEIRVCDGVATLAETLAITAFIHLLAHWFADNLDWLDQMARPPQWVARENKWRSMRYGLDAELVIGAAGNTKPLRDDIRDWLTKLEPYALRLGYADHMNMLRQIMEKGPSAIRQRMVYEKTGDLNEVIRFNMRELEAGRPLWDEIAQLPDKLPKNDNTKLAAPTSVKEAVQNIVM